MFISIDYRYGTIRILSDDKCTLWHRTYYTVEAPSQKEAYALAATITTTEKTLDDDIQVEGSEFLFDTLSR